MVKIDVIIGLLTGTFLFARAVPKHVGLQEFKFTIYLSTFPTGALTILKLEKYSCPGNFVLNDIAFGSLEPLV